MKTTCDDPEIQSSVMFQAVIFLISHHRATQTFSLLIIVFQIMLFPVRQMIIVISGNEMAREPILCWEERQSLALCKKQCSGLGQRDEARCQLNVYTMCQTESLAIASSCV